MFLKIFAAILGETEAVVPIFIHNPKSQQIEAVVVTSLNTLLAELAGLQKPPAAQNPAPPAQ